MSIQYTKNKLSYTSQRINGYKIMILCLIGLFLYTPVQAQVKATQVQSIWRAVENSYWVTDGNNSAPRKIYVFTDMNCPYCHKFWADARPWVDSGKVQLRHILVGTLKPDSTVKAAAILADANPEKAFTTQTHLLLSRSSHTLNTREKIPPKIQTKLNQNLQVMLESGLYATPAIVWLDKKGLVQMQTGVPEHKLKEIFGSK